MCQCVEFSERTYEPNNPVRPPPPPGAASVTVPPPTGRVSGRSVCGDRTKKKHILSLALPRYMYIMKSEKQPPSR